MDAHDGGRRSTSEEDVTDMTFFFLWFCRNSLIVPFKRVFARSCRMSTVFRCPGSAFKSYAEHCYAKDLKPRQPANQRQELAFFLMLNGHWTALIAFPAPSWSLKVLVHSFTHTYSYTTGWLQW